MVIPPANHRAGRSKKSPGLAADSTMLLDMLGESTIRDLTRAFAEANNIAIGLFTPDGKRLGGKPVHHSEYCSYIYSSPTGHQACDDCDRKHFPVSAEVVRPYRCHANLHDFSVPIVAYRGNEPVLIGTLFAGQLRPTRRVTTHDIRRLLTIAQKYQLDFDTLSAAYIKRPFFPKKQVGRIQALMEALGNTIGRMVTQRYEQHSLMQQLSRISSPTDVTNIIRDYMGANACSMFTQNLGEKGRIYLRATSFEPLQREIGLAYYDAGWGLTGWVYGMNRTLNCEDVEDLSAFEHFDPMPEWKSKHCDVRKSQGVRAFIAVPIRDDQGQCVGVIRAVRTQDGKFTELQQETFEAIAAVARQNVELMRRHEERQIILRVANRVLAGGSLEAVTRSAVKETMRLYENRADNIWLTRHLPEEKQFEIVACYRKSDKDRVHVGRKFPEDAGIAGWMLQNPGKTLFSNNLPKDGIESVVESVKACVAYPIAIDDKFFGAFTVASSQTGVFREEHREQLEMLGAQITPAFQRVHLSDQTQREQGTLHAYFACLKTIANLPPPWEPRSVAESVCKTLQTLKFKRILLEVRDGAREIVTRLWRKTAEGYDEAPVSSPSSEDYFPLTLSDTSRGDPVTAVIQLSARDGEAGFTKIDRVCLGLAEQLAVGRLREEAGLTVAVAKSIGATVHGLGRDLCSVRDMIDDILAGPGLQNPRLPAVVTLDQCHERLQSAIDSCEVADALAMARHKGCLAADKFSSVNLVERLSQLVEQYGRTSGWEVVEGNVPRHTHVRVYDPALRRIVSDLMHNAERHGTPNGRKWFTLTLEEQDEPRVRVTVRNFSTTFTTEQAAVLQERIYALEGMLSDRGLPIGTALAAVLAYIHDGRLEIGVHEGIVAVSFTLPVSAKPPAKRIDAPSSPKPRKR